MIKSNKPLCKHVLSLSFFLVLSSQLAQGKYSIPEVKLEAFRPKGLRVSIPNEPGIRLFAFHGRINGMLKELEMGDLNKDVTEATNNFWIYEDPEQELDVGDYIGYWVFVQHNYFGFRKDNLKWEVKELIPRKPLECTESKTVANGASTCSGALIFEDSFDNIDRGKWVIEQYIPYNGPNYEFNYYTPECVSLDNNRLKITPVPKQNEADLRGILDLVEGCTSTLPDACYYKQQAALYLPPVRSGKIKSKFGFKYGRVEITAKLPCGDWISPDISLMPVDATKKHSKILIAFSRGNQQLTANDGSDIGGKLLFSGPCLTAEEPARSELLRSKQNTSPYCQEKHTYSIVWRPNEILSYVDGEEIGQCYLTGAYKATFNSEFYLSLGVAIGGINDFPNDFTSGNYKKPWQNKSPKQLKEFFSARNNWLRTWENGTTSLLIDSVQVYAL